MNHAGEIYLQVSGGATRAKQSEGLGEGKIFHKAQLYNNT